MEKIIVEKIKDKLQDSDVRVEGGESKFTVFVASNKFLDKSMIEQHKMIYSILDEYIKSGEIHALTLKTSPKQNDKQS